MTTDKALTWLRIAAALTIGMHVAGLIAAVAGIRGLYRARGFTRATVMPNVAVLPAGDRPGDSP